MDKEKKSDSDTSFKTEEVKGYVKGLKFVITNMKKLHSIVYGKHIDGVQSLLKAEEEFKEKSREFDAIWILKMAKKIISEIETKINVCILLHMALIPLVTIKQSNN